MTVLLRARWKFELPFNGAVFGEDPARIEKAATIGYGSRRGKK